MSRYVKRLLSRAFKRMLPAVRKDDSSQTGWMGDFGTWEEAAAVAGGYNATEILEKVKASMLQVKNGAAAYERDSVTFDRIQYAWPVLACLQRVAVENDRRLSVLDFGGALGSSYVQNRGFLQGIAELTWCVVEQRHFVDCGKALFETDVLRFYHNVEDAIAKHKVNCLLLSGVLQILPDPFPWITKFQSLGIGTIIVDRTAFVEGDGKLTVQTVAPTIYPGSYPHWFFNENEFLTSFTNEYRMVADFDSVADGKAVNDEGRLQYWKGFCLKKRVD